jgi:hypothetical protein
MNSGTSEHKEHSEQQGRFMHGNDDEGHAADVGDPGATEVPEVGLEYAGTSDDGDYEAAADSAVVTTAAATNGAAAYQAAAQAAHTAQAAQHTSQAPFLGAYFFRGG